MYVYQLYNTYCTCIVCLLCGNCLFGNLETVYVLKLKLFLDTPTHLLQVKTQSLHPKHPLECHADLVDNNPFEQLKEDVSEQNVKQNAQ